MRKTNVIENIEIMDELENRHDEIYDAFDGEFSYAEILDMFPQG